MQKTPRDLIARTSEKLNLPAEATAGLTRLELVGRQLHVENHRGIGAFGPEYMELLTADGPIRVRGAGLSLAAMNNRELIVMGRIASVELPVVP